MKPAMGGQIQNVAQSMGGYTASQPTSAYTPYSGAPDMGGQAAAPAAAPAPMTPQAGASIPGTGAPQMSPVMGLLNMGGYQSPIAQMLQSLFGMK